MNLFTEAWEAAGEYELERCPKNHIFPAGPYAPCVQCAEEAARAREEEKDRRIYRSRAEYALMELGVRAGRDFPHI